ncbi:unnamed protein product [Allacma fusca]|uniref:UBC core domain-containing protein n=1 Tax=Allacma fusca TaxID=39272 RepID=A0A8J2Q4Z7_9HEXA|nr:unnamed protein product [Allacma fusca]
MSFIIIQELPEDLEQERIADSNLTQYSNRGYFVGDIVCKLLQERHKVVKVRFGTVLYPKILKPNESLSSLLNHGFTEEVPVFWCDDHSESFEKSDDIFLVERHFRVGMHVRRCTLTSGNVIAVDRVATVKILGTNQVIADVPVAKLHPLQHKRATLGSFILHHEWLGVVTCVEYTARLRMSNDVQCTHKWSEDMEQVFQPTSENPSLGERIHYPGQQLQLSTSEMWQVNWNSNTLEGKFRVFKSQQHSSATVVAIESIFTVKWLESLPRQFHERKLKPDEKLSSESKDWISLDTISKNGNFPIGNIYTLEYWGEKSWQLHSYEDWLQSLSRFENFEELPEPDDLNMEGEDNFDGVSFCGDNNNGNVNSVKSKTSDALNIWNRLKTSNVDGDFYGKILTVEVLCTQSWVTVRWPNYVKHIEYFSSCEFEPMIFQENPTFPAGSVLKFSRKVGSQPEFLDYYGVVVQTDSRIGLMSTNWYKYYPGSKPCYAGKSNSPMDEVELHPQFGKLTTGSIVTWNQLWDRPSEIPLGIVNHMGEDGMLRVRTARNEILSWPENLLKIPFIPFYNAVEKQPRDLKLYTGNDQVGIWIKTFSARRDLIAVSMEGPPRTLYEDVLLFFTIKIPEEFPESPPLFHFHSFSCQEINPCLKVNGTVLFPLLNTYDRLPGFHMENWDKTESSIGLILVCIRKMILCDTPYKNHRNLEILKLFSTNLCNSISLQKNWEYLEEIVHSVWTQLESPPEIWREDMYQYYRLHIPRFYNRIMTLLMSEISTSNALPVPFPSVAKDRVEALKRKLYHLYQVYQQTFI